MLDGSGGDQRAWLRIEQGVTICGQRMRRTHLPHVYVEWNNLDRGKDSSRRYAAPAEERELESMRLEWSYLEGRDSYRLHPNLQEVMTAGCWMKGTLAELRQLQAAGGEGSWGIAHRFRQGHLVFRSGETAYVARCGMVIVEVRNQTVCTQEIPVTFKEKRCMLSPSAWCSNPPPLWLAVEGKPPLGGGWAMNGSADTLKSGHAIDPDPCRGINLESSEE